MIDVKNFETKEEYKGAYEKMIGKYNEVVTSICSSYVVKERQIDDLKNKIENDTDEEKELDERVLRLAESEFDGFKKLVENNNLQDDLQFVGEVLYKEKYN